jgi:hypothetical protein
MAAAGIQDIVLSTARFFPTAVGVTLGVAGLATARLPWLFVAVGLIPLATIVSVLQVILSKGSQNTTAGHIYETCSLAPIPGGNSVYGYVPSMWLSLTSFLITVFLSSGLVVATAKPTAKTANEALPVQQRKGVGTLSIISCVVLLLFMILLRYRSGCEGILGLLAGLVLGVIFGLTWWHVIMRAGGPAAWDVHGVMIGTQPGSLRTSALACLPTGRP